MLADGHSTDCPVYRFQPGRSTAAKLLNPRIKLATDYLRSVKFSGNEKALLRILKAKLLIRYFVLEIKASIIALLCRVKEKFLVNSLK